MSKFVLRFHDGPKVAKVTWNDLDIRDLSEAESVFMRENYFKDFVVNPVLSLSFYFLPANLFVHKDGRQSWFSVYPGKFNPRVFCSVLGGSQLDAGHYLIPVRENATKGKKPPSLGWSSIVATVTYNTVPLQAIFDPWPLKDVKSAKGEVSRYVSFVLHTLLQKAMEIAAQDAEEATEEASLVTDKK